MNIDALPPTGTPLEALGDPDFPGLKRSATKPPQAAAEAGDGSPPAYGNRRLPPPMSRAWSTYLGSWRSENQARAAVLTAARQIGGMPPGVKGAVVRDGRGGFQGWIAYLRRPDAERVCELLRSGGQDCRLAASSR